jgi:hypothetical protein
MIKLIPWWHGFKLRSAAVIVVTATTSRLQLWLQQPHFYFYFVILCNVKDFYAFAIATAIVI